MDWDILNIFKKAEFNSLMLSTAAAGWILFYLGVFKEYSLIAALVASIYCLIRFVVCCYKNFVARIDAKNCEAQQKRDKELKAQAEKEERRIEISRMFKGLTEENKKTLAYILLKGKPDEFDCYILHFNPYSDDSSYVHQAKSISQIFRNPWGSGNDCIWIKHYTNTLAAEIDPYLYDLIKGYIDKNGLELIKK